MGTKSRPQESKNVPAVVTICVLVILSGLAIHITWHTFWGTYGSSFPERIEIYRGLGQLMSGIGTLGLLALALIKLPREAKKLEGELKKLDGELTRLSSEIDKQTKEQHKTRIESRDTRVAEAAAQILESTYKVFGEGQALDYLCNPLSRSGESHTEDPNDNRSDFHRMLSFRLKNIQSDVDKFYDARIKCRIYFPDEPLQILDQLAKILRDAFVATDILIMNERARDPSVAKKYHDQFYDNDNQRRGKLKELEARLFELLRPNVIVKFVD